MGVCIEVFASRPHSFQSNQKSPLFMSLFSFSSFFPLPLWKILLDSLFGVLMWLMLARFAILIFIQEQSAVPMLRQIIAGAGRILRATGLIIRAG